MAQRIWQRSNKLEISNGTRSSKFLYDKSTLTGIELGEGMRKNMTTNDKTKYSRKVIEK
jgi:hypothetical protein